MGSNPNFTGVEYSKMKEDPHFSESPYLLTIMAGDGSDGWHPLVEDFVLVGRKLEQLGFTCCKGKVTIVEPTRS